ncbi:MAG: homoserine dehydrogenase [Bacteroidetes bacterium RIFOXYA12_FULL_35_11]|nr:MAG: homoserine dehydrogenase [Bacteroidetes bacterium GWF2_35_48]OFY73249.1 MAG: homoserine dehydrogenase [Bacteroidetes bacterium RIFOXYA12_FULL_35_11]OFY97957.1 MAG: homoserine dehydrogenase [Bacteroidetes bacterium RIFOXYC12_FULL_35_7]HBX52922.1 homoserine dehydrogenase [Bacteroidales bacterium]
MKHKIAIIGFGTVGQGITEILLEKKEELKKKYKFEYDIVAIADFTYGNVYNPKGLDMPKMLKEAKAKKKFSKDNVKLNTIQLIEKCNATVVCELTYTDLKTGKPAVDHVKAALSSGKHVVTSNKGPAALKYLEMKKIADKKKVKFLIEGTVVAGTPILNLIEGPLAGCEITAIKGILNGTTNYMLTEMEKGMDYKAVLRVAQDLGYAEADPTGDVEGHDARGKVCILGNVVMGVPMKIDEIDCKGITKITAADIKTAKEKGCRWKLIGSIEKVKGGKIKASVSPQMVELTHPLAGVMGAKNALTFTTDLLGDITIVGPGAGRKETGFAILTDLLRINSGM